MSSWTSQVYNERKAREKLSAAEELERVGTGSELEICHGVELEGVVLAYKESEEACRFQAGCEIGSRDICL